MDKLIKKVGHDLEHGDKKKGKKDVATLLKKDQVQDNLVAAAKSKKGK